MASSKTFDKPWEAGLHGLFMEFVRLHYPNGFPPGKNRRPILRAVIREFWRWAEAQRPEELESAKELFMAGLVKDLTNQVIQEGLDKGEIERVFRPGPDGTLQERFRSTRKARTQAVESN
jgi:hypothetical protein